MAKVLTPIEEMIDKACGITDEVRRNIQRRNALLRVVAAAVDLTDENSLDSIPEGRELVEACRQLKTLGW